MARERETETETEMETNRQTDSKESIVSASLDLLGG